MNGCSDAAPGVKDPEWLRTIIVSLLVGYIYLYMCHPIYENGIQHTRGDVLLLLSFILPQMSIASREIVARVSDNLAVNSKQCVHILGDRVNCVANT